MRRNISLILKYGNVTPFFWKRDGYRCFYCNTVSKDGLRLIEHTRSKHANINFDMFCEKLSPKSFPIRLEVTDIACKVCDQPKNNLEELKEHIKLDHSEDFNDIIEVYAFPLVLTHKSLCCQLCDDKYDNYRCLITHMFKKHVEHGFICQICGASCLNKERMTRHYSRSHVGLRCGICKEIFPSTKKLADHKLIMHGLEQTFSCNLCSDTFENAYQVKVHMGKVHNVEKYRIKCEFCDKECSTKGALVSHMQCMHSEVKYNCDLCDYKTSIKWMITAHKRKHLGLKEYECTLCSKRFARSSNLSQHFKVHGGSVGRVCRVCKKGFSDIAALKAHKSVHMGHFV